MIALAVGTGVGINTVMAAKLGEGKRNESDEYGGVVTALGLYYKWQTFFFIPLGAMQTCIVPIISYNYAARSIDRCKKTLLSSIIFGMCLMAVGTLCFVSIPVPMLSVFT